MSEACPKCGSNELVRITPATPGPDGWGWRCKACNHQWPINNRVVFMQDRAWDKREHGAYSQKHCCYCAKLVGHDPAHLRMIRTNDGEWWLVSPDYRPVGDEMADSPMPFTLPVGRECLKKHPEWEFAVVARIEPQTETSKGESE